MYCKRTIIYNKRINGMDRHEVCKGCVMDLDCLLQRHDDVESCQDYLERETEEINLNKQAEQEKQDMYYHELED